METLLLVCLLITLFVRWIYLRNRLASIESRLDALMFLMAPPAPMPRPVEQTIVVPSSPPPSSPPPRPAAEPAAAPARSMPRIPADWEAALGGNLMSKVGVFVVVIGLALLLNYAYTNIGPAGRVALSYAGGFAMLITGVFVERRDQYRTFAYGLIGGGWAAIYLTTYAMHAITAAKILDNPWAAAFLLLGAAAGMIVHSLRYRSETVTGLAYFIAFVTLAISEVTVFSVIALVPLAASLLYVAHRNRWGRFALFGLIATYTTVALHKDTGAPLWEAQAIFLIYWLLFEGFDLIRPDAWLLPLNTLGFLLLSAVKWSRSDPDSMWIFASGAAILYLAGTVARARSGRWRPAVTVNGTLAAAAILLKLPHAWNALGLLALGEIYYLAGLHFRSRYLRAIAGAIFLVELTQIPSPYWKSAAIATAAIFYLNRTLRPADTLYGYAAAGLTSLAAGLDAPAAWRGPIWTLMAAGPFALGWLRRQLDFRIQGYGLAALGMIATALTLPHSPLSLGIGAAAAYILVLCALWSGEDRFVPAERSAVRIAASSATTAGLAALVWRIVPGPWLAIAWLALAYLVLEIGLRDLPREFRRQSYFI